MGNIPEFREWTAESEEGKMAQELSWLDSHIGSLEEGVRRINELGWYITVHNGIVIAGEHIIFKSDSKDAVEAFLYGMALAYSVLPVDLIDILEKEADEDQ
jgi:hypothetical protein